MVCLPANLSLRVFTQPGSKAALAGMSAPGAKRSLADSFTIVSVASIKMVLGPAPHIRKLHLLDSVARDLQRFWQNGNIHKFGTPICEGFGKPRE